MQENSVHEKLMNWVCLVNRGQVCCLLFESLSELESDQKQMRGFTVLNQEGEKTTSNSDLSNSVSVDNILYTPIIATWK